jgi:hypothetical protein
LSIQKVILRVVHNGVGNSEDSSDYPSSAGNEVVVVVTVMTATVARRVTMAASRLQCRQGLALQSLCLWLKVRVCVCVC